MWLIGQMQVRKEDWLAVTQVAFQGWHFMIRRIAREYIEKVLEKNDQNWLEVKN